MPALLNLNIKNCEVPILKPKLGSMFIFESISAGGMVGWLENEAMLFGLVLWVYLGGGLQVNHLYWKWIFKQSYNVLN